MVTIKQKHAVRFIIETLRIPFKGDIENINDVSPFIGKYLEDAKLLKSQLESIENYYDQLAIEEEARWEWYRQTVLND